MKTNKKIGKIGRTVLGWTQHDVDQLNELMVKANSYNLMCLAKAAQQALETRLAEI